MDITSKPNRRHRRDSAAADNHLGDVDIREEPATSPAGTLRHGQHVQNGGASAPLTMPICAGPRRFLPLSEARSHGQTAYKRSRSPTAMPGDRALTCTF